MDLSVPYSGKWPNDAWLPDFVSDDEDEDLIERFCQSFEIVDENLDDGDADEVDGEDSVVEYVPDVVELLAPVVAVPAPKRANPEPLAPNPRPYAKRKCWTFGQKVSAIQKMERLSLTLCQAEKDLCIPFSNLQKGKKNKAKIFKEFYKATAQGWRDQTRQRGLCKWKEIGEVLYSSGAITKEQFRISLPRKVGSHPNVHHLGRNPTLVNRVSVGAKGEFVQLNDGDVISMARRILDGNEAVPLPAR